MKKEDVSASYKQVTATKKFVMEAGRPVGCLEL